MIKDGLTLKGKLAIAINGETVKEVDNLVVTDGKEYVASRMKDASATAMSRMAIGTGSTAAAASDSALGSEAARVALLLLLLAERMLLMLLHLAQVQERVLLQKRVY